MGVGAGQHPFPKRHNARMARKPVSAPQNIQMQKIFCFAAKNRDNAPYSCSNWQVIELMH
jgi:hypothetical protein